MEDLVNLQMHRHAKTCKKAGNKICRFNFPLLWWPRTANRKIRIPKEELFIFSFDLYILFYFSHLFIYLILNEIKDNAKSVEIQIKMK